MIDAFVFLGIGKLIIFFSQRFPPFINNRWEFLRKLFSCDLCLGFWVYFGLSFLFGYTWYDEWTELPILLQGLTGATASFIMWLLSEGWNAKFREYVIKE